MNKTTPDRSFVIADDQFLISEALKSILAPLCTAVYSVSTKTGLEDCLREHEISLLITDHALFAFDSVNDLAELKKQYPDTSILILTNAISELKIKELNLAGIRNIALKTDDGDEILHAVSAAIKGKKHYSGDVLDILLKKDSQTEEALLLTPSEIEIIRMISSGLTTKEIAYRKHISFHTVMTHRKNIFRKLSVSSSSELLMYAIKAGLIDNIEYHI